MKLNSFISNLSPKLYFNIIWKNVVNVFQKFEVGYTQTCTSLESSVMGHCSVFSPNWRVKVPYLCLFGKMVNNETLVWSIVQGCVKGAKPSFANVTCVIYISFNAPLGLLNGISGKESCKYLIL
jgi:hypothetical protein